MIRPNPIADAHTTIDTPVSPASAIIEHHNLILNGAFATLQSTADCRFQRI